MGFTSCTVKPTCVDLLDDNLWQKILLDGLFVDNEKGNRRSVEHVMYSHPYDLFFFRLLLCEQQKEKKEKSKPNQAG